MLQMLLTQDALQTIMAVSEVPRASVRFLIGDDASDTG